MDSAAAITASTSVSAWSRTVYADAEVRRLGLRQQRVDELEAAVARLRAEKEAAERAAAALRAELETERGATETATNEALLMIGRLQREKGAAMIEAREFRRIVEGRADHDRELQDELDAVHALAASYEELLRAHGIDPDEESGHRVQEGGDTTEAKGVVVEEEPSPSPSPPPAAEEFEYKYAVDVRCAAVAEQRVVAGDLRARVEALEADSAEVRREVAALRAERALVALSWEVTRRVCREAAAARAVVVAAEKPRFSVLAAFKWFFSTILCGTKRSASAARLLRNHPSSSPTPGSSSTTTYLLRGLLPLLERSKGTLQIQSKISGTGNGDLGFPCPERPWCTPL